MAEGGSRFASLNDEDLLRIIDERDSKNTKNVISASKRILNEYLKEKNGTFKSIDDLSEADVKDIVATLRKFYGEVRKTDGSLYAKKSLITLRFGLQKHFMQTCKIDIINSDDFNEANEMFKAVMVQLKNQGKGDVTHKEPITPEDLQKMYSDEHFSLDTPESLKKRVFFEYLYYFCNRGRENIRDVKKDDFGLKRDAKGLRYVRVKVTRQTKEPQRG